LLSAPLGGPRRPNLGPNAMPILDERTLDFVSNSAAQTERLGVRLGELLQAGDLLCLEGDLGAGKTCLARGISRGWGAVRSATSPTFVLINEYARAMDNLPLFHLDCYRLQGPAEALAVGLDDILDRPGAVMIEWPERIADALPAERLWISLRWAAVTKRGICFSAEGERAKKLLTEFRISAFGV
jgi:tRNA threonylcarbamoyladenosine biosynthesis protein TsaE